MRDEAALLKDRLRQRLSEPASLFADGINTAPTMGACEAFEGDIEAAARTVLVEAGGHRAKAKQLLRQRMSGNGAANGKLNGSEVSYWRQLGALSLLDGIADALPAYARAADLAPENAEAQMLAGVLYLRAGNLEAAEAAFRRQIELGNAATAARRRRRALSRPHHAGRRAGRARGARRGAWRPTRRRSARSRRCWSAMPSMSGCRRDLSVTHDRIGDMHAAKGELDAALESYRAAASRSPRRWPSAIRRARCGSTTCP